MANHEGGFEAPGSFVMIMVWFAIMVFVYLLNWKYLSALWPVT